MPPARDDDVVLLTVQEFAVRYRVHIQTVYSAIRRGRLKFEVVRAAAQAIRIVVPRASIGMITDTEQH